KRGELQGLARVRSINMDDSHVFCREDQIEQVVKELIEAAQEMYKTIKMDLKFRLSFRDDSDVYLGSKELWDKAQTILERMAKEEKLDYHVEVGDAAFYGPKIDFLASDVLGRVWQVATVQLDFMMPERFGLSYVDEHGNEARPAMIHCALLGSIERFLAVYLEHTGGKFPVWLAPEQVRIISLKDDSNILKMAKNVVKKSKEHGLRAELDDSNETVAKKILEAEKMKVPYMVVIGEKEVQSNNVAPRHRSDLPELPESTIDELLERLARDAKSRR
ncbi:MAG: threonine--tRNA ligase, partial [Candidatus Saccharimonadales bacterium]